MLKLRPPTHKIDAGGVFVSLSDCWDQEKLDAEAQVRKDLALAEKRERLPALFPKLSPEELAYKVDLCELDEDETIEAISHSPWSRYYLGKTRYQLDAPDHDASGKPVTVREFLKGSPTEFCIRRLSFQDWRNASDIIGGKKALLELCALGLKEIRSPAGGLSWKLEKGLERVPDYVLQTLHEAHPGLISEIGLAVSRYNQPLSPEEGKA